MGVTHGNYLQVLAHGQVNRATGATQMNIQSSRSHALLCVAVKGENKVTGVVTLGMNALYVCAQMNYRRLRLFCHKKLSVL